MTSQHGLRRLDLYETKVRRRYDVAHRVGSRTRPRKYGILTKLNNNKSIVILQAEQNKM